MGNTWEDTAIYWLKASANDSKSIRCASQRTFPSDWGEMRRDEDPARSDCEQAQTGARSQTGNDKTRLQSIGSDLLALQGNLFHQISWVPSSSIEAFLKPYLAQKLFRCPRWTGRLHGTIMLLEDSDLLTRCRRCSFCTREAWVNAWDMGMASVNVRQVNCSPAFSRLLEVWNQSCDTMEFVWMVSGCSIPCMLWRSLTSWMTEAAAFAYHPVGNMRLSLRGLAQCQTTTVQYDSVLVWICSFTEIIRNL